MKLITLIILFTITISPLFGDRLCEESFRNFKIHQTNNPDVYLVVGINSLKWYDAKSCTFIDEMDFGIYDPLGTFLSKDGSELLVIFINSKITIRKYDLLEKSLIKEYDLSEFSPYITQNIEIKVNNDLKRLYGVNSVDGYIIEYELDDLNETRRIQTEKTGLSFLHISHDSKYLALYSPRSINGYKIYLYDTETLTLVNEIPLLQYIPLEEFSNQQSFLRFSPFDNSIFIVTNTKLYQYEIDNESIKTMISNNSIGSTRLSTTSKNNLIVTALNTNRAIAVFNSDETDDYYLINEMAFYAFEHQNNLICNNFNPTKNLFKIPINPVSVEGNNNSFQLYPNPFNDQFTISNYQFPMTNDQCPIEILDIMGNVVHQEKLTLHSSIYTLNLETLLPGTYFVKIGDRVEKVIKSDE